MAPLVPPWVLEALRRLETAGYPTYVVGGAVRDCLLGRDPRDWDLATAATPEQVRRVCPQTIDTGARFGTITVLLAGKALEVTTFRQETGYSDHRRPDQVVFTSSLEQDLARRDFTINAMAWHPERGLVDPLGGWEDLAARRLDTCGEPGQRFQEDALRMLRAIRLAAELNLRPTAAVKRAICRHRELLRKVAAERVRTEFSRLLQAPAQQTRGVVYGLRLLRLTGLLALIAPEVGATYGVTQNQYHRYTVWSHTLQAVAATPPDLVLRLAALCHDLGKPATRRAGPDGRVHFYGHEVVSERLARKVLGRLHYPKGVVEQVALLVRHHMFAANDKVSDAGIRRLAARVGSENLPALFALHRADLLAKGPLLRGTGPGGAARPEAQQGAAGGRHATGRRYETAEASHPAAADELAEFERFTARAEKVLAGAVPLKPAQLAANGRDLQAWLGIPPGPQVGRLLRYLHQQVLDDPARNTPAQLRRLAESWLAGQTSPRSGRSDPPD
ncbi:MAG: HD domain-containing protein [Firmicutes bacterium]|nr:HD domain-containing protein [Bacillota bacterium]